MFGTYDAACADFATSIVLPSGRYAADASLTDAAGRDRTTTVQVVPFDVIRGTSLDAAVDFPASSFF